MAFEYIYTSLWRKLYGGMKPMEGHFSVTTTEPDVITGDIDLWRGMAKMSCGHVISSVSMKDHCNFELSKGLSTIHCPVYGCDKLWRFSAVKYVASFSSDAAELEEMENSICENYIKIRIYIQKCFQCQTFIQKNPSNTSNCVECPGCSKLAGEKCFLCWCCLQPLSKEHGSQCREKNCGSIDRRLKMLEECEYKYYNGRFILTIRACPVCGLLIEHTDACTIMFCKGCKHYFCFICLEWAPFKNLVPCHPYFSNCETSPRQISLPEHSGEK